MNLGSLYEKMSFSQEGRRKASGIDLRLIFVCCLFMSFGFPSMADAQLSNILKARGFKGPPAGGETAQNSKMLPPLLQNVGIDQELDHQIPLDLVFRDETGKLAHLGDYFGKKPVILSLVYFNCPQLCPMVENGLLASLKDLKFDIGQQFNVLTVSIDPTDTPSIAYAKRAVYLGMYNRTGASEGWHFLTGPEVSIKALTSAVGFHYNYDQATDQYAHATAIMVLTPQGKLSRYFYGIRYPAGQVRLALVEASHNKIGSPVDEVLLFCSHYDPATGKYSLIISRILFIAALVTVLCLGGLLLVMFRGGRHAHA
jgi:protein SCO1